MSFMSEATPIRCNVAETLLGMRNCINESMTLQEEEEENDLEMELQLIGAATVLSKAACKIKDIGQEDMCKCRKSKCLKLYCACFATKQFCNVACKCIECANTKENKNVKEAAEVAILERNPEAFESKFKPAYDAPVALHKHGCRYRYKITLDLSSTDVMSSDAGNHNV
jgi:hypothetical protein